MQEVNSVVAHLRHEIMVSGTSNAVFNGIFAWLLLKNGPSLRWSGENSFVIDIVATGLLLPLIVALIVIPLQRRKMSQGKLQSASLGAASRIQSIADRFPESAVKSSLVFGLIGMVIIAPITLLGFHLVGVEQSTPLQYAVFKGLWAGLVAAALVVPMVLIALRQPGQVC